MGTDHWPFTRLISSCSFLAILGENATLECKIIGDPVPAVKWVLAGRIIQVYQIISNYYETQRKFHLEQFRTPSLT